MRLSFTPHPDDSVLLDLHAGDEIAGVTQAKQPQGFRDEGAFDRRAYLASQNIDLVATLRAPELMTRVAAARPSVSTAIALARPLAVPDSSFQLTFLALVSIAGLALPWLERTVQPHAKALRGWRDLTRDAAHEPRAAQFRIDLRAMASWISARLPQRLVAPGEFLLIRGIALSFRTWELLVLTIVLQIGMLALMARDFHRIPLTAPLANLGAVPLTRFVVPFGFLTLGSALLCPAFARVLAAPLSWITLLLLRLVQWFAHFSSGTYRIPGRPLWLFATFFAV